MKTINIIYKNEIIDTASNIDDALYLKKRVWTGISYRQDRNWNKFLKIPLMSLWKLRRNAHKRASGIATKSHVVRSTSLENILYRVISELYQLFWAVLWYENQKKNYKWKSSQGHGVTLPKRLKTSNAIIIVLALGACISPI